MSLLGNIIWLIFGGLIAGVGYIIGGLLFCLTIIGIPFGIQTMKIGVATLTPFGKEIVELEDANSVTRLVLNVIWLVFFGWEIALAHAGSAARSRDQHHRDSVRPPTPQAHPARPPPVRTRLALER